MGHLRILEQGQIQIPTLARGGGESGFTSTRALDCRVYLKLLYSNFYIFRNAIWSGMVKQFMGEGVNGRLISPAEDPNTYKVYL